MAPKSVQTAPEMPADDPKHAARATAYGRTPDALAAARRRQPPVQGAGPCRHLDLGYRGGRGRVSEPDHLLLPHQGGAVRRGRLPRRALSGARGRAGGASGAHAAGIHPRAGRDGDGDGYGRLLRRSPDPDADAARISRRWWSAPSSVCTAKARAPMPARSSGMAGARSARPEEQLAAVLGGRDRRHGRGPCDGPIGRGFVQRDAARAGRPGRRHRPRPTTPGCASSDDNDQASTRETSS